jgi:ubiquinone/menaquinone biosynthesis C-methylase UbiE
MFERFQQRSYELENLDKGTYTPEEYEGCLVELRRVNQWLGDAKVLHDTFFAEIERSGLKEFTALDVGAGSGELLRVTALWAREKKLKASLVGVELNERSAQAIIGESTEFPEISSAQANGLRLPFADKSFDFAIQSLTLHHFDDEGAVKLLREMARVVRRGLFIIDLHRNAMAYFFYTTIGRLFLHNRLLREDGALSILRSFKPEELEDIGRQAGLHNLTVEKYFPSRLVLRAIQNGAAS